MTGGAGPFSSGRVPREGPVTVDTASREHRSAHIWPIMWRVSARGPRWPGYAPAVWGLLFAVPSFVWALGGTVGAQTTVSPSLVKLAQERVTWFVVVLWVTGLLKLIGALVGVGLTRRWATVTGRLLVFCGWGG